MNLQVLLPPRARMDRVQAVRRLQHSISAAASHVHMMQDLSALVAHPEQRLGYAVQDCEHMTYLAHLCDRGLRLAAAFPEVYSDVKPGESVAECKSDGWSVESFSSVSTHTTRSSLGSRDALEAPSRSDLLPKSQESARLVLDLREELSTDALGDQEEGGDASSRPGDEQAHLKHMLAALYTHWEIANALVRVVALETEAQLQVEAKQQSVLRRTRAELKSSLVSPATVTSPTASRSQMKQLSPQEWKRRLGEELQLHLTHADENDINMVNLLSLYTEEQFEAVSQLWHKIGAFVHCGARAEGAADGAEQLSLVTRICDSLVTLGRAGHNLRWAQWQHSVSEFEDTVPHLPSKEEERQLMYMYDIYASSCTRLQSVFAHSSLGDKRTLAALASLESFALPAPPPSPHGDNQSPATPAAPAQADPWKEFMHIRRQLLKRWWECVDGLVSLRCRYHVLDAGDGFDAVSGDPVVGKDTFTFDTVLSDFLYAFQTHLVVETDPSIMRPVIALTFHEVPQVRNPAVVMLRKVRELAVGADIRTQAHKSLVTSVELARADREDLCFYLQSQFRKIRELGISLNKDYFHAERIANHVHLFRSALFFRHGVLLPFHRHQEVGTTEDYAPRDELDEMRLRVRSLSRHRRAYTIDRMVALKLDSASTEMDNVNFNSSIVPVNINSIFHDFRVIGQGAFGEVYSARTKSACALGVAEVAIKRIGLDQPLRGLKREIRVLQLCAHPNVIRLLKTYVWENHMWVVMEFCKGGTIEQLRDAHDMSPAAVSYIARELLKALRFIHDSQRIVHRDMKPENVFVTLQGEVKLGDFGFSMDTSYSTRHDRNSVAGTARYLAPEMLCKRGYASKLDIWSFGCTLLYLVTGSDLHSDLASMEAMLRVGSEGVPKVRLNAYRKSPSRQGSRAARRVSYSDRKNSPQRNSSRRMWDPAAKDFIEHCLAYDPRERWSAAQLLEHPFITQHAAATGKVLHPYLRNKILENSLDGMV